MRTSIILSIVMIFILGKVNSQILELDSKWIYDYRDYSILDGTYTEKFDSIHIVSDTMINGLHYYKLKASQQSLPKYQFKM